METATEIRLSLIVLNETIIDDLRNPKLFSFINEKECHLFYHLDLDQIFMSNKQFSDRVDKNKIVWIPTLDQFVQILIHHFGQKTIHEVITFFKMEQEAITPEFYYLIHLKVLMKYLKGQHE